MKENKNQSGSDQSLARLELVSKSVGRATWGATTVYMYKRVGGRKSKRMETYNNGGSSNEDNKNWKKLNNEKRTSLCVSHWQEKNQEE